MLCYSPWKCLIRKLSVAVFKKYMDFTMFREGPIMDFFDFEHQKVRGKRHFLG